MNPNNSPRVALLALFLLVGAVVPAEARTLVMTDAECEQIAAISSEAPRLGWAGMAAGDGTYSNFYVELMTPTAFLIRYPLDKIPAGQRILNAEWTIPVLHIYPAVNPRLNVQRLLVPWGAGVCHEFRQTMPTHEKWHMPGASAPGLDRAAKPTVSVRLPAANTIVVNVTQDVELWYAQRARNEGWIVTTDQPNCLVRLNSPSFIGASTWILRITYEPE